MCTRVAHPWNVSWGRNLLLAAVAAAAACSAPEQPRAFDSALLGLSLREVNPGVVLPGTFIEIEGDQFVTDEWGTAVLHLEGELRGGGPLDVQLPAGFVDFNHLEAEVTPALYAQLGSPQGQFFGTAQVEVQSAVDGETYLSDRIDVGLDFQPSLTPRLDVLQSAGVVFPNEPIVIEGDGLLLRGEGQTVAVLQGCFARIGEDCRPVDEVEIAVTPQNTFSRTDGTFVFAPRIAGIVPGHFEGTVTLSNFHTGGDTIRSASLPCAYDLVEPRLYGATPNEASLGQYVQLDGAGFVGPIDDGYTLLNFVGEFRRDDGLVAPVDVVLTPEFVHGNRVRYVINEDDAIGQQLDVRLDTGTFTGEATPIIAWGDDEVTGDSAPFQFRVAPVKQVVYLHYSPSYVESLRHFGLRALDHQIRQRVLEVLARDFRGVNVEFREEVPEDYALFARVDIAGPDPNGLGLLGYDNTPGKDTENMRLWDRIGGVNALTQEDGFPGYGGVFIESMFGYSEHPGAFAEPLEPDPRFDNVFDEFREDVGGRPVMAEDLKAGFATLDSGERCTNGLDARPDKVSCAVWILGNLVGTTVAHEIGHSLGLAEPYGVGFHNPGDEANRMMDAERPFAERAELDGQGPSKFCNAEYLYMREILPTDSPIDLDGRPGCF